ncbi:AAA family ATPase [Streptomyces sp. NPDC059629]|uniref:AAA family ATPase n=1 Tax=Streptomyces sp. NPDC059629 TaxID=3346889 RepID=UPI0036AC596C
MTPIFVVQMAGASGAGKSTLAREVARRTGGVVLDYDTVKSTVLDCGIPIASSGPLSYALLRSIAGSLLEQGHPVFLDSGCFWQQCLIEGQALARRMACAYLYVECVLKDYAELDRRMRERPRLRSHRGGIGVLPPDLKDEGRPGIDVVCDWVERQARPEEPFLVDTSRPLDDCVRKTVRYVSGAVAGRRRGPARDEVTAEGTR